MCNACLQLQLPIEEASERFDQQLASISSLQHAALGGQMLPRDLQFAQDLLHQFARDLNLSPKQWWWVGNLLSRYTESEPLYGGFAPILVAFRLCQSKGLKRPRIRLLSADAEPTYFELWFQPGEQNERTVEIMIGGWQQHGRRRFGGWVKDDRIIPWAADRLTTGIRNTIQDLALDPLGVAKAMASRLGICMYCGQRLSDAESKSRGYGATCADNYGLPWGQHTTESRAASAAIRTSTSLEELFS